MVHGKKIATGGARSIVVFFDDKYNSKKFELWFIAKKQQKGEQGIVRWAPQNSYPI